MTNFNKLSESQERISNILKNEIPLKEPMRKTFYQSILNNDLDIVKNDQK